ncbi:hypothetical protein VFPFJ_07322 [Purpureocillium lilacinum]|uniref:Uncharacterized protein n=1 Tax=Purpureocillium lilacinum TaxID=33203 RepID=A0A179HF65_PURLI|nr:hypothetical protein VFPFJ_07322 [Purpureocillium lilacinum]OAQ88857.1 hypothetical protein VFPFJ_07322 [Purpureocillium lilacinum]
MALRTATSLFQAPSLFCCSCASSSAETCRAIRLSLAIECPPLRAARGLAPVGLTCGNGRWVKPPQAL